MVVRREINLLPDCESGSASTCYTWFDSVLYPGALFSGALLIVALTSVSVTGGSYNCCRRPYHS